MSGHQKRWRRIPASDSKIVTTNLKDKKEKQPKQPKTKSTIDFNTIYSSYFITN